MSLRCFVPDRRRLLSAYERSPYPPTVRRLPFLCVGSFLTPACNPSPSLLLLQLLPSPTTNRSSKVKPTHPKLTATPNQVHLINLFHNTNRDAVTKRHHEKVVDWLAAADPPVPRAVAWKVLETGRERFRVARSR